MMNKKGKSINRKERHLIKHMQFKSYSFIGNCDFWNGAETYVLGQCVRVTA